MNIQNAKKLTSILLGCTLMLGGAVGTSAAEPVKETDTVIASTKLTKAICVDAATMADDDAKTVSVRFTPIEGANPDDITISVVPMVKLTPLSDAKAFAGQDTVSAIRLVPAKKILMEKIILE